MSNAIPPRPSNPVPPHPGAWAGAPAAQRPVPPRPAAPASPAGPAATPTPQPVPPMTTPRPEPLATPSTLSPQATPPRLATHTAPAAQPNRWGWAHISLAVYVAVLIPIAFWPVPVDSGAGGLIRRIIRAVPGLTYDRLEFGANVLLFVPLGFLLAFVFAKARYLVLPTIFVTTFTIECGQALFLPDRSPTVYDIIANTAGGCFGLLAAVAYESWRGRRRT